MNGERSGGSKARAVQPHDCNYWIKRDRFPLDSFSKDSIVDFPAESRITFDVMPVKPTSLAHHGKQTLQKSRRHIVPRTNI
jgi:hypothetical protein